METHKKEICQPVIQVDKLNKSFGNQVVLKNISFTLNEGENLVILGKSGSGKSVLIKCIIGLLPIDDGEIKIFGKNIQHLNSKELSELRHKIGFLFQNGALYDSMSVYQNLIFPLVHPKISLSKNKIESKVKTALQNVGLYEALNKMPSQLSGGMRKRISLARTLVVDPQIILYDEPTTGLDPITSNEISLLINEIKLKYKTSSIIITHDIKCATTTADRIIMLLNGEVYCEGSLTQFFKSKDPIIQSFIN